VGGIDDNIPSVSPTGVKVITYSKLQDQVSLMNYIP